MNVNGGLRVLKALPARFCGRPITVDLTVARRPDERAWNISGTTGHGVGVPSFLVRQERLLQLPACYFDVDWAPELTLDLIDPLNLEMA